MVQFGSERHEQELAAQFTLPARQHRSVHNLIWVGENILLSFHVRTVVVWTFGVADDLESATVTDNVYTARTLETERKGMPICVSGMPQGSRDFPTDSLFAVFENRSDGRNDIMLSAFGWGGFETSLRQRQSTRPIGVFLRGSRSSQ